MPAAERRELDKMLRGLAPQHQRQLSVSSSNALEMFAVLEAVVQHRKLVLLLDYDGTLTPIVKDPSKAVLSERARAVLTELPKYFITGVVSGRSLRKIRNFVGVKGLFYAGSHGFDIIAPSQSAYSSSWDQLKRVASAPPALLTHPDTAAAETVTAAGAKSLAAGNGPAAAVRAGLAEGAAASAAVPTAGSGDGTRKGTACDRHHRGRSGGCIGSGRGGGGEEDDGSGALAEVRHQVAKEYLPVMEKIRDQLIAELEGIDKSEVEDNHFSVSVHYRNCAREDVPRVKEVVDRVRARHERIRMGSGKEVFELQPDIAWDKGKAVLWLLDKLVMPMSSAAKGEVAADAKAAAAANSAAGGGGGDGRVDGGEEEEEEDEISDSFFTIFIGDDKTDENAFRALNGDMGKGKRHDGVGILVSEESRETNAAYTLKNPDEVATFLEKIAELGSEHSRVRSSSFGSSSTLGR